VDFLDYRKGRMVFYQVFLLSPLINVRGCVNLGRSIEEKECS
jgi:hypothetical protein